MILEGRPCCLKPVRGVAVGLWGQMGVCGHVCLNYGPRRGGGAREARVSQIFKASRAQASSCLRFLHLLLVALPSVNLFFHSLIWPPCILWLVNLAGVGVGSTAHLRPGRGALPRLHGLTVG